MTQNIPGQVPAQDRPMYSFRKLQDGSWGVAAQAEIEPGTTATVIVSRADGHAREQNVRFFWKGKGFSLGEILGADGKSKKQKPQQPHMQGEQPQGWVPDANQQPVEEPARFRAPAAFQAQTEFQPVTDQTQEPPWVKQSTALSRDTRYTPETR